MALANCSTAAAVGASCRLATQLRWRTRLAMKSPAHRSLLTTWLPCTRPRSLHPVIWPCWIAGHEKAGHVGLCGAEIAQRCLCFVDRCRHRACRGLVACSRRNLATAGLDLCRRRNRDDLRHFRAGAQLPGLSGCRALHTIAALYAGLGIECVGQLRGSIAAWHCGAGWMACAPRRGCFRGIACNMASACRQRLDFDDRTRNRLAADRGSAGALAGSCTGSRVGGGVRIAQTWTEGAGSPGSPSLVGAPQGVAATCRDPRNTSGNCWGGRPVSSWHAAALLDLYAVWSLDWLGASAHNLLSRLHVFLGRVSARQPRGSRSDLHAWRSRVWIDRCRGRGLGNIDPRGACGGEHVAGVCR